MNKRAVNIRNILKLEEYYNKLSLTLIFNSQFQSLFSKFEESKYRYLTDINKFAKPFMARSVTIHPQDCTGGGVKGCGIRWEILGSSKRLGMVIYCY